MESLRPNIQRARQAIWVFWTLLAFSILSFLSNLLTLQFLNNEEITNESIRFIDIRQGVIGVAMFVANILCIVFFILWFRRAYANLHRLNSIYPEHESIWAGICWFIPIINLYRPYYIMKDIWVETQEALRGIGSADSPTLIGIWWGLYLTKNVVDSAAARMMTTAYGINTYTQALTINMVADVLTIIATLVTLEMIRQTSRYEEALYESTHQLDITQHLVTDADI